MNPHLLQLSHAVVDLDTRRVQRADGDEVRLTTREAELLMWLAQRPGQDVSREELQREVWGYADGARTRTVDSTMARLRRKVEAQPRTPDHLIAVTGVGYRYVPLATEPEPAPVETVAVQSTGLLGREQDIQALARLLDEARLVTLLGVGGQGKTTVARALQTDLFVEITECTNAAEVGAAILHSLGVPASGTPAAAAGRVLAARGPIRIVLDNAEQVAKPLASVMPEWLGIGEARFLVTSRVPLGVHGERRYVLPPLDEASAQALFQLRTGKPSQAAGRRLVTRLAGHPLSIELAASRTQRLSAEAVETRAERWLDFLKDRSRVPRHADVRTLLEGSWSLMEPEVQDAWARLAVVGAGDVDLADAVLGDGVELLDELVEHALAVQSDGRWELPELVRSFGRERATEVEVEVLQAVITHAESLVVRVEGPECVEAMSALVALQPALARALAGLPPAWCQRAFLAMGPVLVAQLAEPFGPIETALAHPTPEHPRCLILAARITSGTSAEARRSDEVGAWLQTATDTATDPTVAAHAKLYLGLWMVQRGQLKEGRERMERAVKALENGPQHLLASGLNLLGTVTEYTGADPWPVFRRALRVAQATNCRWQEAVSQSSLAVIHDDRGRLKEADDAYETASATLMRMHDHRRFGIARLRYSGRQVARGQLDAAKQNLEDLLRTTLADSETHGHGWALAQLAYVALNRGNTVDALALARQTQALARRQQRHGLEAISLIVESRIYVCTGDLEDAVSVAAEVPEREEYGRHLRNDLATHNAILAALEGQVPELPEILVTNLLNRRERLRMRAFIAVLSSRPDRVREALDELEACTAEGHRQLRADARVMRAAIEGREVDEPDVSWVGRVVMRRSRL